ncbi:MAG TPA: DUF202 domain-containing protein [Thermoanaerobaculia bacterium]|nr:DUF202 domain-containing protein [Thermoanaerobaculia bacterium]
MTRQGRALTDDLAIDRTALANERTLLAYIRTGLAIVAGGFGIVEFVDRSIAPLLGGVLMTVGGLFLIVGLWRFQTERRRLRKIASGDS